MAVHADCVEAVREAAKLCSELGHEVTEAAPDIDSASVFQAFTVVFTAGGAGMFIGLFSEITGRTPTPEQFEPLTWAVYELGCRHTGQAYLLAIARLQRVARDVARFMVDYDVWLTPTLSEPPLPLGTLDSPPEDPLRGLWRAGDYAPFTPICNFTGQPAASIPLYWNKDGLPIGTHFVGRFGDEATLFRLAAQLEEARPWAGRLPPMSAASE